jgi:nucleotide-binding universal stress UspA family protein
VSAVALNKILVPVDGSAPSIHALEYAAERQRNSPEIKIVVVTVQSPLRPSRVLTRALIAEHHKRSAAKALGPARKALRQQKIKATCHTAIGEPAAAIVAFAKKQRCDEIAMGNSGLGSLARLVMGSVARKVVMLSPLPVVLVK